MERRHLPAGRSGGPALFLLLLGLLAFLPCGSLRADDEAPRTPEEKRAFVAKCLRELRSSAFDVREAARQGLEDHGADAPDLLEAARDDADPEVRRTVRMLLARMGGRSRWSPCRSTISPAWAG